MKALHKLISLSMLLLFVHTIKAQISDTQNPTIDKTYYIQSAIGDQYLEVKDAKNDRRTPLQLWKYTGNTNQEFKLVDAGDGYFYIQSELGRAVHVEGGNKNPKADVNLWEVVNQDNLKWKFIDAGNGYFYIQSKLGTNLDVQWGKDTNGTPIWMWNANNGLAQKWKLVTTSNNLKMLQVNLPAQIIINTENNDIVNNKEGIQKKLASKMRVPSQRLATLIKTTQERIKPTPEKWKKELIALSEKFQIENIELKLIVMDIIVQANSASQSITKCVTDNFVKQIELELLELSDWAKNPIDDFSFMPTLCLDRNEYSAQQISLMQNLTIAGFNFPNDIEFIFYDDVLQKSYNLKNYTKKKDNNTYSINLVNFNIKDKLSKIGEQNASSDIYAIVVKSKKTKLREYIRITPETYNEEKAFYEQQEIIAKGDWVCGKIYYKPVKAIENIVTKIVLYSPVKGDGDFGGDVTYKMRYKFKVSQDRKKLFLDDFSFKAVECCECHGTNISCGIGDFNGNNNSVWLSERRSNILIYEAPGNFEFAQEHINQSLIEESYLISTKEENGTFQRKRKPNITFVKALYLKASTGAYDSTIRGLNAWLRFLDYGLFPLKRVDNCHKD